MKIRNIFIIYLLLGFAIANAQTVSPDIGIVNTVTASLNAAAAKILPIALQWLSSFMALQFLITNFALIKNDSDITAVFGKLIGSLSWFGVCFYLMNHGPDFIDSVGTNIMGRFLIHVPTPGSVIASTIGLCSAILAGIGVFGTSILGSGNQSLASLLVYALIFVFAVGMYMSIKLIMIGLELGLIVALTPLSFSFLGMNALRDQGIAPFKSLIALVYRIILLGIACDAFTEVTNATKGTISGLTWSLDSIGDTVKTILSMLCAYPILVFLVFKSDALATSLAGGSASMGANDVAGAAAAGAAAGAAIGSMGAAGLSGAGKVPQSMANFMQGLMGRGQVSNASGSGTGVDLAPSMGTSSLPAASLSHSGGNAAESAGQGAQVTSAKGAPVSANESPVSGKSFAPAPVKPIDGGSGTSAGISGNGSSGSPGVEQKLDQLLSSGRKTLGDHLSNANQHIANERHSTSVSISAHHGD